MRHFWILITLCLLVSGGSIASAAISEEHRAALQDAVLVELNVDNRITDGELDLERLTQRLLRDYCDLWAFNKEELTERVWKSYTRTESRVRRQRTETGDNTTQTDIVRDTIWTHTYDVLEKKEEPDIRIDIEVEGKSISVFYAAGTGEGANRSSYTSWGVQRIGARLSGKIQVWRGNSYLGEWSFLGVQVPSQDASREVEGSAYNRMLDQLYGRTPEEALSKVMRKKGSYLPVFIKILQDIYGTGVVRKILEEDEDLIVRQSAIIVLEQTNSEEAMRALIENVEMKNDEAANSVRTAVASLRNPYAVPALIDLLKNPNTDFRILAVTALGGIRNEDALVALMQALKDENSEVRGAAANAIGKKEDLTSVPALEVAMSDSDKSVRYKAAWALMNMGHPSAENGLRAALGDEEPSIRLLGVKGMRQITPTHSAKEVAAMLTDRYRSIRRIACEILIDLADPTTVDALMNSIKNDSDREVRYLATKALGEIRDPKAVIGLVYNMKNYGMELREESINAMASSDYAGKVLVERLKDEDLDTRNEAAEALGEIKYEPAVGPLIELMEDPKCRWRASAALRKIAKVDYGRDPKRWKQWWENNKTAFSAPQ